MRVHADDTRRLQERGEKEKRDVRERERERRRSSREGGRERETKDEDEGDRGNSGRCHSAAHKLYEILIMAPLVGWTSSRFGGTRCERGTGPAGPSRRFVNPGPSERISRDFSPEAFPPPSLTNPQRIVDDDNRPTPSRSFN